MTCPLYEISDESEACDSDESDCCDLDTGSGYVLGQVTSYLPLSLSSYQQRQEMSRAATS